MVKAVGCSNNSRGLVSLISVSLSVLFRELKPDTYAALREACPEWADEMDNGDSLQARIDLENYLLFANGHYMNVEQVDGAQTSEMALIVQLLLFSFERVLKSSSRCHQFANVDKLLAIKAGTEMLPFEFWEPHRGLVAAIANDSVVESPIDLRRRPNTFTLRSVGHVFAVEQRTRDGQTESEAEKLRYLTNAEEHTLTNNCWYPGVFPEDIRALWAQYHRSKSGIPGKESISKLKWYTQPVEGLEHRFFNIIASIFE